MVTVPPAVLAVPLAPLRVSSGRGHRSGIMLSWEWCRCLATEIHSTIHTAAVFIQDDAVLTMSSSEHGTDETLITGAGGLLWAGESREGPSLRQCRHW